MPCRASTARATTTARAVTTAAASLAVCLAVLAGAVAASPGWAPPAAAAPAGTTTAAGALTRTDPAGTVWLCRPGLAADPCAGNLGATVVPARGARRVQPLTTAATGALPFDCFYVYPTVSTQRRTNSTLRVTPAEVGAAFAQAQRFSQVCNVWAPMYRQRTARSLQAGLGSDPAADLVAYRSVLRGWQDYLAHDNDGRPVVFIGHSQGAAMLIRLLRAQVDESPALRSRLVSAIIAGANVTVPAGPHRGRHLRPPPAVHVGHPDRLRDRLLLLPLHAAGRRAVRPPGSGGEPAVGPDGDGRAPGGLHQPGRPGRGTAPLTPYFPTVTSTPPPPPVTTPWVTYPGLYSAGCRSRGGATWLQVSDLARPGDTRPVVTEALGPQWGYHLADINLALGNLVDDVRSEEAAYAGAHPGSP